MKTTTRLASLLALAAATPLAAQSVQDFRLPPAPTPTPSPSQQVQGPVDADAPIITAPRVIPSTTPAPSPAASRAPQPATSQPARTAPARQAQQTTGQPAAQQGASPAPRPQTQLAPPPQAQLAPPPAANLPDLSSGALPEPVAQPGEVAAPSLSTAPLPTQAAPGLAPESSAFAWWTWLVALLAVVGAAVGGVWFMRHRQYSPASVPTIEPPLARREPPHEPQTPSKTTPQPASESEPLPVDDSPALALAAAPVSLSRSMRFASFKYRLKLMNRGSTRLEDIAIGADLVAAHGSISSEDQLASALRALPETGRIGAIEPGEEVEVSGEVSLPLGEIRTIRQGAAHLYVPLLRVRAEASGGKPVARTFIVGTLPEQGAQKLQPFRLDEMPQTYRNIGTAALDR